MTTKSFFYFLSNKDKIPNLSKSNVVYEVTCLGCSATYIRKTERRLRTRLAEYTNPTKSAIGQHFHNCKHVQYIVNLHFAFDKLNNPTDADNNVSTFISNLIIDNSRILHTIYSRTSNFLLLLEALYIKYHSPSLKTLDSKPARNSSFFPNLHPHFITLTSHCTCRGSD
jgi:hypothetical protein